MGAVTGKAWLDHSEPRIMAADLEAIEAAIADAAELASIITPTGRAVLRAESTEALRDTIQAAPKSGKRLTSEDLDSLPPDIYYQNVPAEALVTERNYPAQVAGTLIQHSWGNGMTQMYMPYTAHAAHGRKLYVRSRGSSAWQPWLEFLSTPEMDARYALKGEGGSGGDGAGRSTTGLMDELLPIATPITPQLSFDTKAPMFEPRSRGVDGYVYMKHNQTKMARSNDGMATYEISTWEWTGGRDIYWATRIKEGYVALIKSPVSGVNEIWRTTSDDWNTGWDMVQEVGNLGLLSFPQPVIGRGGKTVLIVCEYTATSPGESMHVWLSTDGGETWEIIRTSQVIDPAVNAHWHGSLFDPQRERIWLTQGDGPNAWFGYSDDYGQTWVDCPTPTDDPLYDGIAMQQPTALIGFGDYIGIAPDRGPYQPGMWQADADTGRTVARSVIPGTEGMSAHHHFGIGGTRAQRGQEAYVAFPDFGSGNRTTYILGTGDGGRSWHLVHTYEWGPTGSASTGIAGPDAAGYVYFKPSTTGVQVAKTLGWEFHA